MAPRIEQLNLATCLINGDPWEDKGLSMRNMLLQWHSIHRVWNLFQEFSQTTGQQYRVVVFLRPDMEYLNNLELDDKQFDDHTIFTPQYSNWGGCNDRFAMGSPAVMAIYANRTSSLDAYLATGRPLHSEKYLLYHLTVHGLKIGDAKIVCRRIRTNGIRLPP